MIIELAEKLVDRCLQLMQHRNDQQRRLLDEYVAPMMATFQELHELYVKTFRDAHESISNCANPVEQVGTIGKDLFRESLFNSSKRSLLVARVLALNEKEKLSTLIEAVHLYLNTSSYWFFQGVDSIDRIEVLLQQSNRKFMEREDRDPNQQPIFMRAVLRNVRATVARGFHVSIYRGARGSHESFRADRLNELEQVIERLQRSFIAVQLAYEELRQEILH